MSSTEASPRITAANLGEFQGKTVRILGRVASLRGEQAQIESGGQCNVHITRDAHLVAGNWAEVVGKVNGDLSITAMLCTDWGSEIGQ